MDCKSKFCAWMALAVATGPLAASAQVPQAQEQPPQQAQPQFQQQQPQQAAPQLQVVATVNGDPITDREVQAGLQAQLRGQQVDPQTAAKLQQQVVDNLIDSRLVEQFVLEQGPEVKPEEVKQTLGQVEKQVAAQNSTLDQFLATRGYTPEMFESRIEGSLAWQKYQQEKVTEENLQRHFEQNKDRFNAPDFEQARQEVTNSYVGEVWVDIVSQMKPNAEIRLAGAERQAPPAQQPPQRQPTPQPTP